MDKRIVGIAQRSLGMHLTGNYKREEIIKEMKSLYSGTDEDRITFLMDKIIEIYESLIQAISNACGNPDFVRKEMYFMTVIELLSVLSTNDILFVYKGDRVEEKTDNKLTEEDLKNIDELVKLEDRLVEKAIEDEIESNKIIDDDKIEEIKEVKDACPSCGAYCPGKDECETCGPYKSNTTKKKIKTKSTKIEVKADNGKEDMEELI